MGRPSHSPIWPFLLVVGFLFVLSIAAPRDWERIARRQAMPKLATSEEPRWEAEGAAAADLAADGSPTESADAYQPAPVAEPAPSLATESRAPAYDQGASEINADRQPATAAAQATAADDSDDIAETTPAELSAATPTPASALSGPQWAAPVDLLRRLGALSGEPPCTVWAHEVARLIVELTAQTAPTDARAATIVTKLRLHAGDVDALLPAIDDRRVAVELLRVRHALVRRLDVWEMIPPLIGRPLMPPSPGPSAIARLAAAVARVEDITGRAGDEGHQWRRYLALDALRAVSRRDATVAGDDARQLARDVTSRLNRKDFTDGQRTFVDSPPVAELAASLRPWTSGALDPVALLADVERFEFTNQPGDARRVADDYRQLSFVTSGAGDLPERLETNYRNANVRLALSERLLKRLMPPTSKSTDPVRDEILGVPTVGTSTTATNVDVKLVPNDHRLRVSLEATGQIFSNTRSTSGPATVYTRGDSRFHASKLVDLDLRGIRTFPAESECLGSNNRIRSVNTDFDAVPLVGALVENFARSRHADQQPEVRSIVRRKIEAQTRRKMDELTEERLKEVNNVMQERLLAPLERMHLDPQVISSETSEQRLTMRLRLASEQQLAGHTPRPRAPSDSLLSLQIHQSLFNNVCEQLKLAGRTYRLPELRAHIIQTFNLQNSHFMDESDRDVTITFADENAISVRCEEGRVELTLAVARLANDEHAWKNFRVRIYYQPQVEGLQASFVRDGVVQLTGERLSARSQIALRSIFSKVFAKDRNLVLVDPQWSTDERTRDLAFTQFVIQDGWIAVAVAEPRDNVAGKRKPAAR